MQTIETPKALHAHAIHASNPCMQGKYVQMYGIVHIGHAPNLNCSTQMFLKVMTACKNVSAAISAACAPPILSSRKKAKTTSS